jgi:hypothetical protein
MLKYIKGAFPSIHIGERVSIIIMNAKKGQVLSDPENWFKKRIEPTFNLFPWCEKACPKCGKVCEQKVDHDGEHRCLDEHLW